MNLREEPGDELIIWIGDEAQVSVGFFFAWDRVVWNGPESANPNFVTVYSTFLL